MRFFQYRATAGEPRSLVALDTDRHRFYRYVATTGLWHHDTGLGEAVDRLDPLADRAAIAPTIRHSPRLDERHEDQKARANAYRHQITDLGEVFTGAELGLTMTELDRNRPITTPGLPALLEARGQHWTVLSRYSQQSAWSASYTAVDTAQRSTRFARPVEARRITDLLAGHTLVILRLTPEPQENTPSATPAAADYVQAAASARELGTTPVWS